MTQLGNPFPVESDITLAQARANATWWGQVTLARDDIIESCLAAGLTRSELAVRMGIARTTIDRAVPPAPAGNRKSRRIIGALTSG